jgi:hypothetical protein
MADLDGHYDAMLIPLSDTLSKESRDVANAHNKKVERNRRRAHRRKSLAKCRNTPTIAELDGHYDVMLIPLSDNLSKDSQDMANMPNEKVERNRRRAHRISLAKWRKEQLSVAIRQIGQRLENETDQEASREPNKNFAYETPSLSYHLIPRIGAMPRQEVQDFYNWRRLWPLLQTLGWRAICLNNETVYTRQMCDPGDGKITLGVDYFSSPEEVIQFNKDLDALSDSTDRKETEASLNSMLRDFDEEV